MTANEIVDQFAQEVNRLCETLQGAPDSSLETVEELVGGLVRRVGRQLVGALFEQVLGAQRRPLCPGCGAPMHRQGRLSVSPVTDAEWTAILKMAGE